MKKFLAFIDCETQKFTLNNKSTSIEYYHNSGLHILFNGYILNTTMDNLEFIAQAYQNQGIDFLKSIEGNFSLALYDEANKKLFIAKDKVGTTPLYFRQMNNTIVFGTRLRDFETIEEVKLTLNPNAIANYLQFGFILQPNTIFQECYKVNAGEYVEFELKTANHKREFYWQLELCYSDTKSPLDEVDIIQNAHKLLNSAIESNTKNTNHGLSLSGGYDSSTLVAIAQAQSEQKIDTFTIGFHENEINEAPYAKAIAQHIGTNHHEHYFTAQDAVEFIPKMCEIYDEPFADHASSPTMVTAHLLKRDKIDNLIAGDGGDEIFATADNLYGLERLKNTPYLLKQLIAQPLSLLPVEHFPYLKSYKNLPKKYDKLVQILLAKNIPQMIKTRNTLFMEKEFFTLIINYSEPIVTSFESINFEGSAECVDEIIGTYFKTTMTDGELVKSYSAMNHENIRLSTPYLNSQLVEYMANVPSKIKVKNGVKKHILKEIAYQYIPKELIERPKCGFDIPFGAWMKNELKDILYSQINKKRLDKDKLFYTSTILSIRDKFYAGNDAYKYKLWRIFIFQLWYENFTSTPPKG